MADPNIFAQYLRPIRSVSERMADMDAMDLRREQLVGAQRQNALAALAAQQTQAQMADAAERRNRLQSVYSRLGPTAKPQDVESALLSDPLLMEQGTAMQKHRIDVEKTRSESRAKQAETLGKLLTAQGELATRVMATPTRQAALASIKNMRMMAQSLGVDIDMSDDEMTVSQLQDGDSVKQWAAGMALKAEKLLPTIQRFGAGDRDVTQAVDPVTGAVREVSSTPIGQSRDNAATVAATMRGQNLTDARAREGLAQAENLAMRPTWDAENQVWVDRGKQAITPAPVPGGGKQQRTAAVELRKEFNALPEVQSYKQVLPLLAQAKSAPDTSQGDISIIYAAGKIYDPNSVVREGEMNLVIKSGSPEERINGFINYIKGGGRLTPSARANLVKAMAGAVVERKAQYDAARTTYDGLARKAGLDPGELFVSLPEQPAAGGSAPSGGRPTVSNW